MFISSKGKKKKLKFVKIMGEIKALVRYQNSGRLEIFHLPWSTWVGWVWSAPSIHLQLDALPCVRCAPWCLVHLYFGVVICAFVMCAPCVLCLVHLYFDSCVLCSIYLYYRALFCGGAYVLWRCVLCTCLAWTLAQGRSWCTAFQSNATSSHPNPITINSCATSLMTLGQTCWIFFVGLFENHSGPFGDLIEGLFGLFDDPCDMSHSWQSTIENQRKEN